MATLEELVVALTAETGQLRAELNSASKAVGDNTKKMDDALAAFTDNSSKNLSFFESSMASMAGFLGSQVVLGAFNLLKDAIGFVGEQFQKGAEDANKEETALTRLANALALSGHYSRAAMADVTAFTGEMEKQTGVADDVVASNLATLASLTKLDTEGLKKAEKAALDMSVAMGVDLNTAVSMVGKGINGHTEAFGKMGIKIQEGGTKAENLANILQALSGTTGSAAGVMNTFQGLQTKINNSWGNMVESLATVITHNQAVKNVMVVINDTLTAATDNVDGNNIAYQELVAGGLSMTLKALANVIGLFDLFGRIGSATIASVEEWFADFGVVITGVMSVFDSSYKNSFEAFKMQAVEAAKKANAAFTESTALESVSRKLTEMGAAADAGFEKIRAGSDSVIAPTVAAGKAVAELTAEQQKHLDLAKELATQLAESGSALQANYDFQLEVLKVGLDNQSITIDEYYAARKEAQDQYFLQQQSDVELAHQKGLVSETQYQNAKVALARKQSVDSIKLASETKLAEDNYNKQKLQNLSQVFGQISTLSESHNSELAAIGKAAAITQATIDGFLAVQNALAQVPYPFNFAAAALVGVAAAANVAKIAGVPLAEGGVIQPRAGGTQATIGEAGEAEAVIPLSKLPDLVGQMGGGGGGSMQIELSLKDGLVDMIEARIVERQRNGTSLLVTG